MTTDIDERTGWPDELKTLLTLYPRDSWRSRGNAMTEFWLDRHEHFRRDARALARIGEQFREDETSPEELGRLIVPPLQLFLSGLYGHHQIEDLHYFPAFREAHENLAAGFDVLGRDHELLHAGLVEIAETVNDFLSTLRERKDKSTQRATGERYVAASVEVFRRLMRHLDDEEDLIIPIMLHRD